MVGDDDDSDETYLADVLATAEDSSTSAFCETFSFTDSKGFVTKLTLCESDQTLSGPLSVLVSKYQYKQNYE